MGNYRQKTDITCEICGYQCGNGYLTVHLKEYHKISKETYISLYPNAKFCTDEFLAKRRKAVSQQMYLRWQDETYKAKMHKVLIANANNKEFQHKRVEALRCKPKKPCTEEERKLRSERMKQKWKDPVYRKNQHTGVMNSEKRFCSIEKRKKLMESTTRLWSTEEYRNKVLARGSRHSMHIKYTPRNSDNIINLMSLQELRVAYLLDLCNIKYKYGGGIIQTFQYKLGNKLHTYTPDFQCDDVFIEVKPNGWESISNNFEKLTTVQLQNNILLFIYDDDAIDDYMPKISRCNFLQRIKKYIKNECITFNEIYQEIGDVRSECFRV